MNLEEFKEALPLIRGLFGNSHKFECGYSRMLRKGVIRLDCGELWGSAEDRKWWDQWGPILTFDNLIEALEQFPENDEPFEIDVCNHLTNRIDQHLLELATGIKPEGTPIEVMDWTED